MKVEFKDLDAEGVILMNESVEAGLGMGMATELCKELQKLLPNLSEQPVSRVVCSEYALGQVNPLAAMFGDVDVEEAINFDGYAVQFDEGTNGYIIIAATDEYRLIGCISEGSLEIAEAGDGFNGVFPVPLVEWDEFVEKFCELKFVD